MLTIGGAAVADDGRRRFIVTANGDIADRIEAVGFEVTTSILDGEVLGVLGDDPDELATVQGVHHVTRDFEVAFEDVRTGAVETGELLDANHGTNEFDDPAHWDHQWDKRLLDVPAAHETATGQGVRVAVVDTGIQPGHPDIDPNLNEALSVRFENGEKISDSEPQDGHSRGHGTSVAGIVAGAGVGTVGVAPDAELVSINIFQDDLSAGFWTFLDLLSSLEYALEIEADVVNMSLLATLDPEASRAVEGVEIGGLRAAIERLTNVLSREGIVMAGASGNESNDLQYGGRWFAPGGQHGVLNVSATGPNDALAYYSNSGSRWIDVAGPGGGYETVEKTWCMGNGLVLSCESADGDPANPFLDDALDGECACDPAELPAFHNLVLTPASFRHPVTGGPAWVRFYGTSAAAPQVAGIAALVREANPDLNALQTAQVIEQSAEYVNGKGDEEFGAGRVNAAKAVEEARK